jgi:hypothetical protein
MKLHGRRFATARKTPCFSRSIRAFTYPQFVGTFDGIVNRYFVLPFTIPGVSRPYRIVENWSSRRIVVERGISCEGFSLAALRIDSDFTAHLDERRIPSRVRTQALSDRDEWENACKGQAQEIARGGVH